jgi:hypothetical protein
MFHRRESERERTLLRLIESQQRQIDELLNRIAWSAGTPWTPPPPTESQFELEEPEPVTWTATPEEEPVY